jgi:hypothetical protein
MNVKFTVKTKVNSYTATLKQLTPDEHALLVHLKHKLQQEYENSDYEDDINYEVEVVE